MDYSLKDVLKKLKILFVTKKENMEKKELELLELFFGKVILSTNSEKAIEIFFTENPDVIITDIDIEKNNGIKLCKEIREINNKIPIIILSNLKNEEYLFSAIRLHVVDYILRPTQIKELIYALNHTAKQLVNHGNINIKISNGSNYDYKEKILTTKDNKQIKLTKNEFKLFELLLANKHRTLTKEEIIDTLWANKEISESGFKSLFSRLRTKIGKDSIENSFGIGYQLK